MPPSGCTNLALSFDHERQDFGFKRNGFMRDNLAISHAQIKFLRFGIRQVERKGLGYGHKQLPDKIFRSS